MLIEYLVGSFCPPPFVLVYTRRFPSTDATVYNCFVLVIGYALRGCVMGGCALIGYVLRGCTMTGYVLRG